VERRYRASQCGRGVAARHWATAITVERAPLRQSRPHRRYVEYQKFARVAEVGVDGAAVVAGDRYPQRLASRGARPLGR